MKVWKLDDCDYVAGESEDQVLRWYENETGVRPEPEYIEPTSLDEKVNVADEGDPPALKTFDEVITEMQAKGESFPAILGTDAHYA